jgi:hypothetical protein
MHKQGGVLVCLMLASLPSTSDADIPGVAVFWCYGIQPLADVFHRVGDRDMREVFHTLVAELPGDAQANWSAVTGGISCPFMP